MDEIFRVRADAAEDPEDRLDEKRRLEQLAVEEMRERVEMADIVALAFEAGAASLAELFDELLDLGEGVADDAVARLLDIGLLPVMLPRR